jgi:hypothetical protein
VCVAARGLVGRDAHHLVRRVAAERERDDAERGVLRSLFDCEVDALNGRACEHGAFVDRAHRDGICRALKVLVMKRKQRKDDPEKQRCERRPEHAPARGKRPPHHAARVTKTVRGLPKHHFKRP